MNGVLIACEESQIVCSAFRSAGYESYSCDIKPCSGGHPEWHIQEDCLNVICSNRWDLVIAHPPCTYLSTAGSRFWNDPGRQILQVDAFNFVMDIIRSVSCPLCLENPNGYINSHYRKPDQIIYPCDFGDTRSKRTSFWLFGLPPLFPTKIVASDGPDWYNRVSWSDADTRRSVRSKFFPGVAAAMADQWGYFIYHR